MHETKKTVLEGLLFLSGDEGLTLTQLKTCGLEMSDEDLEAVLDEMMQEYLLESHGIELVCYGGVYKFVSKPLIHSYAQKLFSSTKTATLSNAAMETLAIIAYKQPITRAEIEEIRGVSCDMMVRKLLARNLIKECGRSDAPGRPFLYEVTEEFMDTFKLESLKELPELPEYKEQEEELFDE